MFASTVAPFGGFLASAIKRAYKVKDFSDLIPEHGGVVDRFDCQFIQSLATLVYFQAVVGPRIGIVDPSSVRYSFVSSHHQYRHQCVHCATSTACH